MRMSQAGAARAAAVLLLLALVGRGAAEVCTCSSGFVAQCTQPESGVAAQTQTQTALCKCLATDKSGLVEPCLTSAPASKDGSNCPCTREYIPQCNQAGENLAPNKCVAKCKGLARMEVNNYYCGAIPEEYHDEYFAELEAEVAAELAKQDPCLACDQEPTAPVCNAKGAHVGYNACSAQCSGYVPGDFSAEYCRPGYRESVMCGCNSTEKMEEVCNSNGRPLASSACVATCLGYQAAEFSPANCDAREKACICPLIYTPVCDAVGKVGGGNSCSAKCQYGEEDAAKLTQENCDKPWALAFAACKCSDRPQDMCDSQGTVVAESPCVATCLGYKAGEVSVCNQRARSIFPVSDAMSAESLTQGITAVPGITPLIAPEQVDLPVDQRQPQPAKDDIVTSLRNSTIGNTTIGNASVTLVGQGNNQTNQTNKASTSRAPARVPELAQFVLAVLCMLAVLVQ